MRKLINLTLCLVVLAVTVLATSPQAQAPDHGGKIETKYDGFNYETTVTLKKMTVNCRGVKGLSNTMKDVCISLVAKLHGPGKQLEYVRDASLQLIFETKDWDKRHQFGQRDLIAVADNESLKLGTMQLVVQDVGNALMDEVMKEVLEITIPYPTFAKLAKAENVEMKVGNTVFQLREKNLLALRDLTNRIVKPGDASSVPSATGAKPKA